MKKIYFIILNYNTAEETKECVRSIKKMSGNGFAKRIIIVDNASTDQSCEELEKCFDRDADVELYQAESNLGFSKGNNYGYRMVREKKDADFCVVCNSDIKFVQENFLSRLETEYKKSDFYVCGPDVYCESCKKAHYRGHQSPMYPFEWNRYYLRAYKAYYELACKEVKGEPFDRIKAVGVRVLWTGWKGFRRTAARTYYGNYRRKRHENVPIHGSCIILSKKFLEKEEILFYPETKFFGEELLLCLRCKRNHYKIIYVPELLVHHLQGRSTSSMNNTKQRALFCYENYVLAAQTYLKELENVK